MGNLAIAHECDAGNVVPFVTKHAAMIGRVVDVLIPLAPDAKASAIHGAASKIVLAMKPGARGLRAGRGPYAWQAPVGSRARLKEYGFASPAKASAMGLPAEWQRGVLIEAAGMFGRKPVRPADLQMAALHLFDRTTGRYVSPDAVWFAYAVLTIGAALTGKRLTVYQHSGRPGGTALGFVREIHRAVGRRLAITARWPAEYVVADRLLALRLPGGAAAYKTGQTWVEPGFSVKSGGNCRLIVQAPTVTE